ncbi:MULTISPECIES: hypothetical protein [unclassified Vibrio]|uniref:hypothetical protein n=1 Tax=unclassified Vibrio TaxID=2614977 RepID=UPI002F3EFA27
MTHPLKSLMIVIFSIVAMLMSSYAASSPSMVSMMFAMDSSVQMSHQQHASDQPESLQTTKTDCHSFVEELRSSHSMDKQPSTNTVSCSSSDDGPHRCCVSACSTTFYPIQHTQSLSDITYSLALHYPLTIGNKIMRPQSFLRPPSA